MKKTVKTINEQLFDYFSSNDFTYSNNVDVTIVGENIRIYINSQYCVDLWKTYDDETGSYDFYFSSCLFDGFDRISNIQLFNMTIKENLVK